MWISSSGRAAAYRRKSLAGEASCASYLSSGERMFAGGHRFPGSRTPAKPQLSEVMIFLDVLLRQSNPYRRWCCAGEFSSGERMFAGGGCLVVGRTPAKPRRSEVIVFLDVVLRQSSPYRRTASAPVSGALIGVGIAPGSSTPGSECSPEEDVWWEAELRRSRGGRR